MKEIIINLKQDLSSFISTISSEMLSIKDNIIKQKNKEVILIYKHLITIE